MRSLAPWCASVWKAWTAEPMAAVQHLVVPGLLGFPADVLPADGARLPHLERVLTRGRCRPAPAGYAATLLQLAGLPAGGDDPALPTADLPSAALRYLADTGVLPSGPVLQADPVYLQPDQDRLLLFDHPSRDLTDAQAAALCAAFNHHFGADGFTLEAPTPGRWYLLPPRPPALQTTELPIVLGRNVDLFLPRGPEAAAWRSLLNEVQMLFHAAPANAEREAAGQVPVSGIWLSGGGALPTTLPAAPAPRWQGDADALSRGLQQWRGQQQTGAAAAEGIVVELFLDALQAIAAADPDAWLTSLQSLEARLAQRQREPGTWVLHRCDGQCHHWQRGDRWRWWRRPRPLSDWLRDAAEPALPR